MTLIQSTKSFFSLWTAHNHQLGASLSRRAHSPSELSGGLSSFGYYPIVEFQWILSNGYYSTDSHSLPAPSDFVHSHSSPTLSLAAFVWNFLDFKMILK